MPEKQVIQVKKPYEQALFGSPLIRHGLQNREHLIDGILSKMTASKGHPLLYAQNPTEVRFFLL